jgi:hypothetical protein
MCTLYRPAACIFWPIADSCEEPANCTHRIGMATLQPPPLVNKLSKLSPAEYAVKIIPHLLTMRKKFFHVY